MDRMKTFSLYLLMVIVTYFLVNFFSFWYIKTTYKIITQYTVDTTNPVVTIQEAQATAVNGYIRGSYKNISKEFTEKQRIKIEMFSENGTEVGTKYITMEELKPEQKQEFEIKFNFINVKSFRVTTADLNNEVPQKELKSDDQRGIALLLSTIIMLYFM